MARQALLRPVEITSANDELVGPGFSVNVPHGTYANIFHLVGSLGGVTIVSPFRVAMPFSLSGSFARLLGYDGAETAQMFGAVDWYIANHAPAGCWISRHQHATPERWATDPAELFSGVTTMDGRLHGVTLGSISDRQRLTLRWPLEPAANVYPDAATVAISVPDVGTWRPEQAASFWHVTNSARTAYSSGETPGAACPKGLYYVPDLEAIDGASGKRFWYADIADGWMGAATQIETWGSGGLNFCGGDKYAFCSVPNEPKLPTPYNGRDMYYDCEVALMTAAAPRWYEPEGD